MALSCHFDSLFCLTSSNCWSGTDVIGLPMGKRVGINISIPTSSDDIGVSKCKFKMSSISASTVISSSNVKF